MILINSSVCVLRLCAFCVWCWANYYSPIRGFSVPPQHTHTHHRHKSAAATPKHTNNNISSPFNKSDSEFQGWCCAHTTEIGFPARLLDLFVLCSLEKSAL